jgi:hypothetical protein
MESETDNRLNAKDITVAHTKTWAGTPKGARQTDRLTAVTFNVPVTTAA